MRKSINRLIKAFGLHASEFVEQDGQNDRHREFKDQPDKADRDRIAHAEPEIGFAPHHLKVIETDVFPLQKWFCQVMLPERHQDTTGLQVEHRRIAEDKIIGENREKHQQEKFVFNDFVPGPMPLTRTQGMAVQLCTSLHTILHRTENK